MLKTWNILCLKIISYFNLELLLFLRLYFNCIPIYILYVDNDPFYVLLCILMQMPSECSIKLIDKFIFWRRGQMSSKPFHLPFFFLLGPLVFTSVVTCSTSGSRVCSTDMVRISKFFGSHLSVATWPNSPIVPMICTLLVKHFLHNMCFTSTLFILKLGICMP